jgi:hypothetical protein
MKAKSLLRTNYHLYSTTQTDAQHTIIFNNVYYHK